MVRYRAMMVGWVFLKAADRRRCVRTIVASLCRWLAVRRTLPDTLVRVRQCSHIEYASNLRRYIYIIVQTYASIHIYTRSPSMHAHAFTINACYHAASSDENGKQSRESIL